MSGGPAVVAIANEQSFRMWLRRNEGTAIEELGDFCESSDFLEHADPQPQDLSRRSGRLMYKARTAKVEEQLAVYLRRVAAQIDLAVSRHGARFLVLVAPPLVLGRLRDLLTSSTRMKLAREITRDLINEPGGSIEALLDNIKA
ncbi:MAG: host attachment protein [Hyphomonadaceae bacterium]|nr:host attachment protein [Hyphomonadaceae bacterium]